MIKLPHSPLTVSLLGWLAFGLVGLDAGAAQADRLPNFVVIFADDKY